MHKCIVVALHCSNCERVVQVTLQMTWTHIRKVRPYTDFRGKSTTKNIKNKNVRLNVKMQTLSGYTALYLYYIILYSMVYNCVNVFTSLYNYINSGL